MLFWVWVRTKSFGRPCGRVSERVVYFYIILTTTSADPKKIGQIVWFLENHVIRHYDARKREGLLKQFDWKIFERYLDDLECPSDAANCKTRRLQWLLIRATAIAYEDNAAACNDKKRAQSRATKIKETVIKNEREREGTTAGDAEATSDAPPLPSSTLNQLKELPLGFCTGSDSLNAAATVLRMRYTEDLRALQNDVNRILVTVQEFTADPKTDTSLGRVGR